jgi:hypothetical protein
MENMDTSRIWGGFLCIAIVVAAAVFLWGISLQSYWALAIPVMLGFLGILTMGFWIGWTIMTIRTAPPMAEPPPPPSSVQGERRSSSSDPSPAEKKPV